MDIINVGIIGAGRFGEAHAQAYACMAQARVTGVFDPDGDRAAAVAERYGGRVYPSVDELVSAPDIGLVSIATPEAHHVEPFRRMIALEGHYRGDNVADGVDLLVEYESGATATIESGWLLPDGAGFGADDRCSVACEQGTFELRIPGVDYIRDAAGGAQAPNPYYNLAIGDTIHGPLRVALEYAVTCHHPRRDGGRVSRRA